MVGENIEPGIYNFKEALAMAENLELDLVEISPTANPPVCRIVDYKKFLYELKKKQKEIKAKTAKVVVKEIRMGPQTDEHDFNFKLKHAKSFLQEGLDEASRGVGRGGHCVGHRVRGPSGWIRSVVIAVASMS